MFSLCRVTIACVKNIAKRGVKKFRAIIFSIFVQPMNDTIILSYSYIHFGGKKLRVRKLCMASLRIKLHDVVEYRNGNSWFQAEKTLT